MRIAVSAAIPPPPLRQGSQSWQSDTLQLWWCHGATGAYPALTGKSTFVVHIDDIIELTNWGAHNRHIAELERSTGHFTLFYLQVLNYTLI